MHRAALIVAAVLTVLFVMPEVPRYSGERRQRMVDATLAAIAQRAKDPGPLLRRLAVDAEATRTFPGDWRPLVAAGRASYAAGDYAQAIAFFDRANAFGERPEIDVNLGMAWMKLGDRKRARTLFDRAVALSPALAVEIGILRSGRVVPR
jgi:tetratricopeptide (TPR) repeat protein